MKTIKYIVNKKYPSESTVLEGSVVNYMGVGRGWGCGVELGGGVGA